MKYALFDNEGLPLAFYSSDVHEEIPSGTIEITDAEWMEFLENQGLRKWDNGAIVEIDPPGPTPEEQRKIDFPNLHPDQFWFGLRAAGYEDDVREWVAGLKDTDPVTWAWASSKLEFATFFERDHPLVEAFREAADITETELDALWSFAAQ